MLLRLLCVCVLAVSAFACKSSTIESKDQKAKTYLALGDSYTIGEGVLHQYRYPNLLVKELNERGDNFAKAQIIAESGWSCEELMVAIQEAQQKNKLATSYDMVSLLIGVNDQYRGYDTTLYPARFEKLLQIAIQYAGGKTDNVFVLSIPDWGITPFAKRKGKDQAKVSLEIDTYNRINKEVSLKHKVKYIDITPISRDAQDNNKLLTIDGLHPSGKMYARWVEKIVVK